jgi:DNA polymerase-3 subunit alpha
MLAVLPQAQAAGQQAQEDAQLGQGSIFDLEEPGGGSPFLQKQHPPVPRIEDERKAIGEMEKETLGLFLSSHPLKEVRAALRVRVDCSLADLKDRKDGDWVTVGGMIAECKRIRTKKGDMMMFATLDDLEGQCEILVFNSAYAQNADKLDVDAIVVVRGRVDHKERGETKLVVQEVEPFDPTPEEIEIAEVEVAKVEVRQRIAIEVGPEVPALFIETLKEIVSRYPGEHEVLLAVGERRVLLGAEYRVSGSAECRVELAELPGTTLAAA